tara:strand:+ start:1223 stop:3181 length:1959 start_codon:yes stop_codon:yes gene_type:complete
MKFKSDIEASAGFKLTTGAADTYVLTSDATGNASWAAASGGGGGAGEKDFVATGAIGAGVSVALRSDGTVEVVEEQIADHDFGTAARVGSYNNASHSTSLYHPTENKLLVAYNDNSGTRGLLYIGTITGEVITWNSGDTFCNDSVSYISMIYDELNNKVVIYYSDSGSSGNGTARVATINPGNTYASFGTATTFSSYDANYISAVYNPVVGKSVVFFQDDDGTPRGIGKIGTVSGTSISFSGPTGFTTTDCRYIASAYDSLNEKIIVTYNRYASYNNYLGKAIVCDSSTLSYPTFGTEAAFATNNTSYNSITYNSVAQKSVITYGDITQGEGLAIVASISGMLISFGTPATITNSNFIRSIGSTYDVVNNRVLIVYDDYTGSVPGSKLIEASISGTNISLGTPVVFTPSGYSGSNSNTIVYDPSSGKSIVSYEITYTYSIVYNPSVISTNAEKTIGITKAAIADAATGTITVLAGTNDQQSGLTIGDICYVNYQGTITQILPLAAPGFKRLGIAVSATEILLDLQETQEQITITESQISDLQAYLLTVGISDLKAELSGSATLPTGNNAIDFEANIQYDKTLDAVWAPTFTNPIKGKSIVIIATGANAAYTLTVPATVKGDISEFEGTKTNQLTLYCLDATTPVYSIDVKTW